MPLSLFTILSQQKAFLSITKMSLFVSYFLICVFLLCLYLCLSIVSLFVSFYCVCICVFPYLCLHLSRNCHSFLPQCAFSLSLSLSLSLTHLFHFRAAFETEFLLKAQSTYIPYLLFHFLSLSLFLYSTCIIP